MSAQNTPSPLELAWNAIAEARKWLNTDRSEAKINALVALNAVRDDVGAPDALCAFAAPDLLEALERARSLLVIVEGQFSGEFQDRIRAVTAQSRAAIAKAQGESA